MPPVRLLIWCPLVNPGGGARLLGQLLLALTRQPSVEFIRVVAPEGSLPQIAGDGGSKLQAVWLSPTGHSTSFWSWLENGQRVRGIGGTGRTKYLLLKHIASKIQSREDALRGVLQEAARDCDLVYAFWPQRQEFPSVDRPIVCTFQDATNFEFPEILGDSETRAEFQRCRVWLAGCAQVVVSSAATRAIMVRHFGESCKSAVVIGHAIVPEAAREMRPLSPVLQSLPAGYIVCPANITPHKNHYNLLVAWSRLRVPAAPHLVLFGPGTEVLNDTGAASAQGWGWQASRLIGLVRRTGLRAGQDFTALGFVDNADVMPLINRAAALIMPTMAEGGGSFPVEEALSLGVPVLCSDIPVMREHLAGRTAKIGWFDPESPDSIAAAAQHLLRNYDEYKAAAVRAAHDPRPTWDDVAAQYVEVFQEVVAREAARKAAGK